MGKVSYAGFGGTVAGWPNRFEFESQISFRAAAATSGLNGDFVWRQQRKAAPSGV